MAATSRSGRRSRRAAEERAAKERRQKILMAVLGVILVIVLAVELPGLIKRGGGSSSSSAPTLTPPATTTPTATTPDTSSKTLKALLRQAPRDVFTARTSGSPTTLGSVAVPPGLHDPFAQPNSPEASVAPPAPKPVTASPLPGTIIIGTPGAGRVAVKGWIVILASIPTDNGKEAATSFAAQARKRSIGTVSVLNSSNKRPLRGGYWVVYTGPYNTLAQVSVAASDVHGSGFTSAYIRELIVYKKKA
jgi:hypothetical protein